MTEMENVRESVLDSIEAGELDADLLQQALALETQARALARKSASADGEAEDLREDLESLDRSLTDLALQMPPGSAAREAVRDAEALADGALSGLDPTKSGDPESGPDSSDSGRQDPDAGTSKPDPAGTGQGDLGENGANALANGATDGRISAPPSPVDANPAEGGAATRAASDRAHGVAAGRWWPESYAGVVERWAQARRSARTEPTSERD